MARAQGARATMQLAFESTYGTAPASGFFTLPFSRSGLSESQPLIEDDLLGRGRDPYDPTQDAITNDGAVEVPIDVETFGFWLKAAFGSPSTTGSDPYTHVFNSGSWSLPSMAIEVGNPEVPNFDMFAGVKVDTLDFSMQRSGAQLRASVGLIGQSRAGETTTQAGTPTAVDVERFGHFQGAIERDGSALANIVSADVRYSNGLDRIEVIRSDGLIEGLDPSKAALTGSITVRFADTTLLTQASSGAASSLSFAWSLGAGKSLEFLAHRVFLPRPRRTIEGPGGIQATFDWQAAYDSDEGEMLTVTLINSRATY